jgi:hypothetical protein
VDDGRVEIRGHDLRGAVVRWAVGGRSGLDRCVQPQVDGGVERCSVAVGHGLPADPASEDLDWLPAGAHAGADVVTWSASGRRVPREERILHPARIVVASLLPAGVSIDLAGGTASRIPLAHPEAVAGVDCGAASCALSGDVIVVGSIASVSSGLTLQFRLAPRVVLQRGDQLDAAPAVQVPVLPCSMSVASGDALRDVEARTLRWFSAGRALDVLSAVDKDGATYVLLGVGRLEGDDLVITASRGDASIVGQARARVRGLEPQQVTLTIDGGQSIDFLPTNRPATAEWARVQGTGELVLAPLEGVYGVTERDGSTLVQGRRGGGGFVALRFVWRVATLPAPLSTADLAVVVDPVARPMHAANIPVPLGASALGPSPLVELLCGTGPSQRTVLPGAKAHVPFAERDACRLVLHRERLSPEDGAQALQLNVEVTGVDGTSRPEAHVTQAILMRPNAQPTIVWVRGVVGSFDRVTLSLSHAIGETSYAELAAVPAGEPSVQWSVIFGTGHFRLYATTAIPTGMYRVSDPGHSGILTLNFGALMRATWLDDEGHGGFVGLEAGMMAEGLANDKDASGDSLTQVATVTGIGLSVPIANRSLATETSINLHAWFEYEVSRALAGNEPGSPLGFVFGPSLSIGNIGTNL